VLAYGTFSLFIVTGMCSKRLLVKLIRTDLHSLNWMAIDLITLINLILPEHLGDVRWHRWLRHCATKGKVKSSIPDIVIGIFN
jgi:hypothetical protein